MKRLLNLSVWTGPTAFAISVCWLLFLAVSYLWPAAFWMEVTSVRVLDAYANEPIRMTVDRRIYSNFHGTWAAQVRVQRLDGDELACPPGAGTQYYKRSSVLPQNLTLGWWTEGKCETLPPGHYVVETTWTIEPSAWPLPKKKIHVTSNTFEVRERE